MSTTDYAPVGIVDDRDTIFTTLSSGAVAAILSAVDTGPLTGGRWFIDGQSVAGLFSIAYDPSTDESARLVLNDAGLLPDAGAAVTVTVRYHDRNGLDAAGNPRAGSGFVETLVYGVEAGGTRALAGFGGELAVGPAATGSRPDLATLSNGGVLAVWETGGVIAWQVRGADGAPALPTFTLTSSSSGGDALHGAPAVAALADGRALLAYTSTAAGTTSLAYRVIGGDGRAGPETVVAAGAADLAAPDAPDVIALHDGGFALAWRSGGQVHVRSGDAAGRLAGPEQVYGALGTAFSPSLAAHGDSYIVSWGELGDGNVHAALAGGAAFGASGDGLAATLDTAAPQPAVAVLADGGFVVAWDSYANSPWGFAASDIFFQRFDAGGQRVGGMTQANVDGGGGRFDAQVQALAGGGFVVAWQSDRGDFDGNGVFGRRFGADGEAIDAREFGINEMRQGDQSHVALSALADGGFASAWLDVQDGGAARIEMRMLAGGAGSRPDSELVGAPASAPPQTGGDGADLLFASAGSQHIDGRGGLDTVRYAGLREHFDVAAGAGAVTVTDRTGDGGVDTLVNVERLAFGDLTVGLDIDGNAGQAYRLYQAAFDRTPDAGGLGFWIGMLDKGLSLRDIAPGFTDCDEFDALYGVDNSDADFVELLYANALHRTPDAGGFAFWLNAMEQGYARSELLAYFSESVENQEQVSDAIQHGIVFTPYG